MGGHTVVDNSRGMLQWVQSISFVAISVDHSMNLVLQAESPSPGKLCSLFHSGFPLCYSMCVFSNFRHAKVDV